MKTLIGSTGARRGTALIVTFLIVLLVGLVCAAMFQYSNQQSVFTTKTRDYLKAKVIAEAGVNQAYNKIRYNFSTIGNPNLFPLTEFGGGSYDVTASFVGSNTARLISLGRCGTAQATVIADLLRQTQEQVKWATEDQKIIAMVFTNYAVLAGGTMDWGGGGIISNGGLVKANSKLSMVGGGEFRGPGVKVFSSQEVYVQGSSHIYGDAYSPSFSGKTQYITGVKTTQQNPVTAIPLIDLTPFYQRAYSNNQVKSGTFLINKDYKPAGNVLWVNGDLKISGGNLTGCFIATGNIDISTQRKMTATNGFPLVISRDGTIKVTATPTMDGLLYARGGSIDWSGGGTLNGSLIAAGYINKSGGSDLVINFVGAPPVIPDIPQMVTNRVDYVVISAWQL